MKEGHRSRAPEFYDILQQQQSEQRSHSSVGHYDGQNSLNKKDFSVNGRLDTPTYETNQVGLCDKEKVGIIPTSLLVGKSNQKSYDLICDESFKDKKLDEDEVEVRPSSRKVSQDRPRLDKSQSIPTYESVVGDMSSFEDKLRDIRLRKQSRVEEEQITQATESYNHDPSPTIVPSKFFNMRLHWYDV